MLRRSPSRLPLAGLLALSTTAFVILVTELLPAGLLPPMSASLHVPEGRIGWLGSAYAAAATLAAIPLTVATRRLPRRPLLMFALGGFGLVNAITALSSSYSLTLTVRVAGGLLGGVIWSMLAGYAARLAPAESRGRAIAIALSGITVALAGGIPAGAALAQWIGWRGAFWVLAGASVGLVVWVRRWLPAVADASADDPTDAPVSGRAARRDGLLAVARRPGVARVLAVTGVLLLGHQLMYTYVAVFAARAGLARAGVVLLVFGVSALGGIAVVGTLVDRRRRPATLGALALIASSLLALGTFGSHGGHPAVLIAAVAVWGFGFGGVPTLLQTELVDAATTSGADVATSLQTTVYNAGVAGGSFAGGVVLDGVGVRVLPWVALPLVAAALILAARRRSPGPAAHGARPASPRP